VRNRLTIGLALLRAVGIGAVLLLLVNPTWSRPVPASGPPLVLLDASLSMTGPAGPWQAALDSARRLAAGGPIWRFGSGVAAFDSGPPGDGATRLAPALAAAAARGGAVVVVTDGAVGDASELPPTCGAVRASSCCRGRGPSTRSSQPSTARAGSRGETPYGSGWLTAPEGRGKREGGRVLPSRSMSTADGSPTCP
jgi:hypothetical protein